MESNESGKGGRASGINWQGILFGLFALFFLIGTAAIVLLRDQRRDLAVSTSPDGSWSVAVVGQKLLLGLGGIEVCVEVRDRQGRPLPGSYVIDQSDDWASAKKAAGKVSCGDSQAVVDGRTILKTQFVPR